jgi:hypothetical protein
LQNTGFKNAAMAYYQLHTLGDNEIKAKPGDYITVDLIYKTPTDSVFFRDIVISVTGPSFEGSAMGISVCFRKESATFIISDDFFSKDIADQSAFLFKGSVIMKATD